MATTAATLIQRCRRFMRDYPDGWQSLNASMSGSTTTLTVLDSTYFSTGMTLQVDTEGMLVVSVPGSTTVTVARGIRGTTATTHSNGASILLRPAFFDQEYLEALNAGISATFPLIYRPVANDYTNVSASVYEYDVPNHDTLGVPIPYLSKIQYKEPGDLAFRDFDAWTVIRGATPFIKLRRTLPTGGTLRITGFGPMATLTDTTSSLDALFPVHAEYLLVEYACQHLLASGEAARAREDTGARDQRENAVKTGANMSAANSIYQRFLAGLRDAAMPPMPKHVVSVL